MLSRLCNQIGCCCEEISLSSFICDLFYSCFIGCRVLFEVRLCKIVPIPGSMQNARPEKNRTFSVQEYQNLYISLLILKFLFFCKENLEFSTVKSMFQHDVYIKYQIVNYKYQIFSETLSAFALYQLV